MQEKHYLVPHHSEGSETDIVRAYAAPTVAEAADMFVDAKDRLLNVTKWDKYGSIASVHFRLADSHKHIVTRNARRADHIVITETGEQHLDNYDWLTIDALEYDDYPDLNMETFAIRVHLSDTTLEAALKNNTTATIVVERRGKNLSAIYHGRNNTTEDPAVWHGLQDTQWSALMKGLLESDEL